MMIWTSLIGALVAMSLVMMLMWWIAVRRHNAGIVDVAWSFGTALVAVFLAWQADGLPARRWIIGTMVTLWGFRLGAHLWRRMLVESEDGRYAALREQWGAATNRNLFIFFQFQASWTVLFALPMLVAARNPDPLGVFDGLAILVWLTSWVGESISDAQLARFKARPGTAGTVCRDGLWRYSRHPNYFFEWIQWWAYVLLSIGSPWVWWSLAGPVVMYVFLTRITGIPPTEARAVRSRGDAYRAYQKSTNMFFPGPPREEPVT